MTTNTTSETTFTTDEQAASFIADIEQGIGETLYREGARVFSHHLHQEILDEMRSEWESLEGEEGADRETVTTQDLKFGCDLQDVLLSEFYRGIEDSE